MGKDITGLDVVAKMRSNLTGQLGVDRFDLISESRRAATVLLGERDSDTREATQLRVFKVAELGIEVMCAAIGIRPGDVDGQPAEFATIRQAREVMDGIAAEAARGAEMPKSWSDLIEALTLMSKHPMPESGPTRCAQDELIVCVDDTKFTPEEIARLDELGFSVGSAGGFYSYEFGNC